MRNFGKNGSFFVPLVVFGAIVTLISILGILFLKADRLEGADNEAIGEKQIKLFTAYQVGEKYLHFVDESAKIAIKPTLLEISRNGLKEKPDCLKDKSQKYTLWARQDMDSECKPVTKECYPKEQEEKDYFADVFKNNYGGYIDSYNEKRSQLQTLQIPKEYGVLKVESDAEQAQIVGFAKEPIVVPLYSYSGKNSRLIYEYKVKPSFRIGIDVNFLKDGTYMTSKAPQLFRRSEVEIGTNLDSFNAENPTLQWNLDSYTTIQSACTYNTGITCKYVCGQTCSTSQVCTPGEGENAQPSCSDVTTCVPVYCDGTYKRTVSYNEFSSLVSASESAKVLVNNPATSKPEFKNPEYDFGLSWIETTGSSDDCTA